ncbi:MAG TPA: TCR/Tet family MFS transporter [Thermoanaerobaculia bacterium]|nr:TCR/Tet family MFS transporter [Thermoanaerobaculia bacterium]
MAELASAPAGPSPPRRAAVAFIFVTMVLDVLAFGIILPVLPKLVESFVGGDTARAARLYGLFGTAWALMQFLAAPLLGALSDRFGRRPVLLLSLAGLGLDYVLMALAPNLAWLFVGRLISGVTAASFATANAYIADVTPPEKRAASYGLAGAAFGLGFVTGPALGGILGAVGPRLPFWVSAGLSLANALYGLLVLPESLPRERREAFSWRRANSLGSLRLLASHPELGGLAGVSFLFNLAHHVLPSVFVLYAGYRYHWTERDVGLCLALVGVSFILVQGFVVRRAVERLGERPTLFTGLVCGCLGFLCFALASTGGWMLASLPVFALMGFFGPAAQALMTRHVSPSEQGQLQGANASIVGITGLLGPGLFTLTFSRFLGSESAPGVPGAPFYLAAGILALALLLAIGVTRRAARPAAGP